MADMRQCIPCKGTGVYPLDIERFVGLLNHGWNDYQARWIVRGCGACGGEGAYSWPEGADYETAQATWAASNPVGGTT